MRQTLGGEGVFSVVDEEETDVTVTSGEEELKLTTLTGSLEPFFCCF